jgi:hypothetical protein
MIVDNFLQLAELYADHPQANDNDTFLFGQILARKKDGGRYTKSNAKVVKDLVFRTPLDLIEKKDEIKELCELYGARAYVNVNPRSYKAVCIEMAGLCLDYIRRGSESATRTAFSTVCGRMKPKNGYWVVDIDDLRTFTPVCELLPTLPIEVRTVNGYHLLVKGFDTRELKAKFPEVDIHKNNPTLLYYGG